MSDFLQSGPISTLHLLGECDVSGIEAELQEAVKLRPVALVLPCLVSEMDGPALSRIMITLDSITYVREIIVTLGPATSADFVRAREYFKPLQKEGRIVRIIWNDGERIQSLYDEITQVGLSAGPHGKGRSAWLAYGYVVARRESYVIALHDCDILTYSRSLLARLVYPTVMPNLDYEFCKGYYSRITDRMHGRVTRLLVTPLVQALITILGELPLLQYYRAFRYPLSGEFSMVADLARVNRIPADWGLEVGVLAEVFRNCSLNRICQVELCGNYEHKHQELSEDDPDRGLNKMAIDICKTIFRVLYSSGIVLSSGFFNTLQATFLKEAQDVMAIYHDDARINGLVYDRHAEATAVETFTEAVQTAGQVILENPLGPPQISNWNRIFSALPDFAEKLRAYVDEDNRGAFDI